MLPPSHPTPHRTHANRLPSHVIHSLRPVFHVLLSSLFIVQMLYVHYTLSLPLSLLLRVLVFAIISYQNINILYCLSFNLTSGIGCLSTYAPNYRSSLNDLALQECLEEANNQTLYWQHRSLDF
jgi:hypothetical protein